MIDIEEMAQERAARTVESNPDAKTAEGLLATAIIQGAQIIERPWEHSETFDFGAAIRALKLGMKVARKGWNGKGMFLWLKPAVTVKAEWCKDPMLKKLADANGGEIEALGTICMFTAQHQILSGWLASQADVLSEDWMVIS